MRNWWESLPSQVWGEMETTGDGGDGVIQPDRPVEMVQSKQGPVMLHEGEGKMQLPNGKTMVVPQSDMKYMEMAGMSGMKNGGKYMRSMKDGGVFEETSSTQAREQGLAGLSDIAAGKSKTQDNIWNRAIGRFGGAAAAGTAALKQEAKQAGYTPKAIGSMVTTRARDVAGQRSELMGELAGMAQSEATQATRDLASTGLAGMQHEEGVRRFDEGTRRWEREQGRQDYYDAVAAGDYDTASKLYQEQTGKPLSTEQWEKDIAWAEEGRERQRKEWADADLREQYDNLLRIGDYERAADAFEQQFGVRPDMNQLREDRNWILEGREETRNQWGREASKFDMLTKDWEQGRLDNEENRAMERVNWLVSMGDLNGAAAAYKQQFGGDLDLGFLQSKQDEVLNSVEWGRGMDLINMGDLEGAADQFESVLGFRPSTEHLKVLQDQTYEQIRQANADYAFNSGNRLKNSIMADIANGVPKDVLRTKIARYIAEERDVPPNFINSSDIDNYYDAIYGETIGEQKKSARFAAKMVQYEQAVEAGSDPDTLKDMWSEMKGSFPDYMLETEPDWDAIAKDPQYGAKYNEVSNRVVGEISTNAPSFYIEPDGSFKDIGDLPTIKAALEEKHDLIYGKDSKNKDRWIESEWKRLMSAYTENRADRAVDYVMDLVPSEYTDDPGQMNMIRDHIKEMLLKGGVTVDENGNVTVDANIMVYPWEDPKVAHKYLYEDMPAWTMWRENYLSRHDDPMDIDTFEDIVNSAKWDFSQENKPLRKSNPAEYTEKMNKAIDKALDSWHEKKPDTSWDNFQEKAGTLIEELGITEELWKESKATTVSQYKTWHKNNVTGKPGYGSYYNPVEHFDESKNTLGSKVNSNDGAIVTADNRWTIPADGQYLRFTKIKNSLSGQIPPGTYKVEYRKDGIYFVEKGGKIYKVSERRAAPSKEPIVKGVPLYPVVQKGVL